MELGKPYLAAMQQSLRHRLSRDADPLPLIVQMGTLKVGQPFICGHFSGKVKSLISMPLKSVKEAGPAMPVKVLGSQSSNAGDELTVMDSENLSGH